MICTSLFLAAVLAPAALQAGDAKDSPGTVQAPPPAHFVVPEAPPRTAVEALELFEIDDELRVDLVAADPLIGDPIAATFAPDGSLWVVEMRGYMPDADGRNELEPIGAIAVLHDDDGDGTHDRRVEFKSELVLPRAVLPTRGGALVLAPPQLLFCRDTDGDGRADEQTIVDAGLAGLDNPEHAVNGLLATLDNAVACANHNRRYRWSDVEDRFVIERTSGGGQWGLTQDNFGALFYNTNSTALRTDAVPSRYGARNPNHGDVPGTNENCINDNRTWPVRATPGVNRGYHKGLLDNDGKLTSLTAACGPHVDRGATLPDGYAGNAFVCEPAANLIKRYTLQDDDGDGHVHGSLAVEGREFFASHDERFRPVNLFGGPDGALYVVDMYRGIIQHRIYMTTFLRRQVDERELAAPIGMGRIWRIAGADAEPAPTANIAAGSDSELVTWLGHRSGWWRDAAQRTLVQKPFVNGSTLRAIEALALDRDEGLLARIHALWTLAGRNEIDAELADQLVATASDDPRWATQLLRAIEPTLAALPPAKPLEERPPVVDALRALSRAPGSSPTVLRQVAFTAGAADDSWAFGILASLLEQKGAESAAMRSAVMSGLRDREHTFLARLLGTASWRRESEGRTTLIKLLSRATSRARRTEDIDALLALAPSARAWQQRALFDGVLAARDRSGDTYKPIAIAHEPASLETLTSVGDPTAFSKALDALSWLTWPGRPPRPGAPAPPRAFTDDERASFERGRTLFASTCAACHQPSGLGEPGLAPPLRHSPYALGDPATLARIVLHGLEGPVDVHGTRWDMLMPSLPLPDGDIADVLTYVRREWGHGADPVPASIVATVRAAAGDRSDAWTIAELKATSGTP